MDRLYKNQSGFTIVELLVVIVVIGILAAITIVSYTGISSRANVASLQSDLDNASKQLKIDQVVNSTYPATLAAANNGKGIIINSDTMPEYIVNNSISPPGFCITATKGNTTYKITENTAPATGNCTNYGLVGYWSLDNTTGITDVSSYGNNGTSNGGITVGTTTNHLGSTNKATIFDGVDDYVNVGDSFVFNIKNLTVCAWIRPAFFSNYQSILAKQRAGDSNEQFGLLVDGIGNVAFQLGNSGTAFLGPVSLNTWSHICGSTNKTTVVIYVNSQALGNGTDNSTYGETKPFRIGNSQWGGNGRNFNGFISDVRIYNRALSQIEITNLYNSN